MKKHVWISVILLLSSSVGFPQRYAVDQGSTIISGTASFASQGGDLYEFDDKRLSTIVLSSSINYFVAPNFSLGASLALASESRGHSSNTILQIGPNLSYFIGNAASKNYPFLTAGVRYYNMDYRSSTSGTDIVFGGGIIAPVKDHLGIVIAWQDSSGTGWGVYAQRVTAAGTPQWTTNGVVICNAANNQTFSFPPGIAPDGAGGAIVTWGDQRSGASLVYAQRVSGSGAASWTANGVALCSSLLGQAAPRTVSDDAGGAIVTWIDYRSGTKDIYAQRVSGAGALLWASAGVALCTASGDQTMPQVATDASGGAIAAWCDYRNGHWDIYAQRVNSTGTTQWTGDGVALLDAPGTQVLYIYPFGIVPDGAGGAIVARDDNRAGNPDIYAQRVNATGGVQWTSSGVGVSTSTAMQVLPRLVSDGAGGAIVAWQDYRTDISAYAQRVDRWGYLGVQPTIVDVLDVPGDEGGQVSVSWTASPLDPPPRTSISDYWIWRQVPSALAQAALARGARLLPDGATPQDVSRGVFRTTISGTTTYYWEFVGTQTAQGVPTYSYVAPTSCDSVAAGNPLTAFMVEARGLILQQWWFSDPDSGYSVDNLAPPAPCAVRRRVPGRHRHAELGSQQRDRLRRCSGSTAGPAAPSCPDRTTSSRPRRPPATWTSRAHPTSTSSPPWTSTGTRGRRPRCSRSGTADARGTTPRELALSAPAPNPLRGSTTLCLALPRASRVALAVYDQQGRRLRTLLAGTLPAGEHAVTWDGRDEGGRGVANGIYFVRCEVEGRTFTRRIAAIR